MVRAPCCEKGLKKGRWTDEEDDILIKYIQANGEGSWRSVPKNAGLQRCGKSCRLRWINYLRPDLKRGNITAEEEVVIIKLHASMGNRWSLIAGHLPGRTDNEIKNYWNSHLSRNILAYPSASKAKAPMPKSSSELTANWNLRRGRSRQLTSSKSSSLVSNDTKGSVSMCQNEELELVKKGKTMKPETSKETFEITEYFNEEGEGKGNTSNLNAEDSLILTSAQKPSYYTEDLSEVLCSLDNSLNKKVDKAIVNLSTQNSGVSSLNQKNESKSDNKEVDNTYPASWNGSKGLSLTSSADEMWTNCDWKGLVNSHKLLDEDEMLSMLWDDGFNLK